MQIARHVEELQRQLLAAAAAGGEAAEEMAGRLVASLDAAAHLAILEALSEAAGEITRELAPGSVDVRLRGRDVEFVVAAPVDKSQDAASTPPSRPAVEDDDDASTSRTTVRLPDALKTRADAAAATEGVSLNTWLIRAVTAALEPRTPPTQSRGSSYTGWVR